MVSIKVLVEQLFFSGLYIHLLLVESEWLDRECSKEPAKALYWLQNYYLLQMLEVNLGYTGSQQSLNLVSAEFYETGTRITHANPLKTLEFHFSRDNNYLQAVHFQRQC